VAIRKTDNFIMRVSLETIENVVGSNGLKSILYYGHLDKYIDNFPPDDDEIAIPEEDLRILLLSLVELFGRQGARSLQLRVGREFVRIGLKKRPHIRRGLKILSLILPEPMRMRFFLKKYVEEARKRFPSSESRLELKEDKDFFYILDRDYYGSEGIMAQTPVCDSYVGVLQYFVELITGHKHDVEEIQCRAMGYAADVFRISKGHTERAGKSDTTLTRKAPAGDDKTVDRLLR
jgi:predicted hydrocarbon binding protein